MEVLIRIKRVLSESYEFGSAKVVPYGSTAQGTYMRNSDLDLAIIETTAEPGRL